MTPSPPAICRPRPKPPANVHGGQLTRRTGDGRSCDYGRQTGVADAGTRWQSEARLGKPRVGGVGIGLPSDHKPARAGVDLRGTA